MSRDGSVVVVKSAITMRSMSVRKRSVDKDASKPMLGTDSEVKDGGETWSIPFSSVELAIPGERGLLLLWLLSCCGRLCSDDALDEDPIPTPTRAPRLFGSCSSDRAAEWQCVSSGCFNWSTNARWSLEPSIVSSDA